MNEEMQLKYAKLIAAAWMDEQLLNRLRQEPAAVLAEYGITIPGAEHKRIVLVEDTSDTIHLLLPYKPDHEQKPSHDLCCMPNTLT
ncbi:hypothetical protein CIG75_17285 [Tumebacillus algifaecis]|uniref:NHLP leader peptide family natural product n=1 Tax=Tumebacillus algifaecis TaxID=1214604 RepID=A0A223D4U8_9BACL|nr:hypothetical protein [Tumebacillus algifaecis]ASS76540.1 hypothetical protein CIG75_17285 [Tumebacillus algifaecis]